jgi:hypothetical protein
MQKDQQGNSLSGATPEAAGILDQAVDAYNIYRADLVDLLDQSIAAAPELAMAHITKAYVFALATEPEATAAAAAILERISNLKIDQREASHVTALQLLLDGQWSSAARHLDRHNADHPLDMIALQAGHLMDFYRGNARNLRDRIARVLPCWSPSVPGSSIVRGMYAFGLEECGDYARAEDEGRRAVAENPLDCWAHHAVAHVMEMQGRAEDGIGWMAAREPHWAGDSNAFKVHLWWHRALCHLDLGQQDDALALYDDHIVGGDSAVALDLIDASALLWRLHLAGCDPGDRWQPLAHRWDQHADGSSYPFNDWHAVMAYLGAGRDADVERIRTAQRHGAIEVESGRWAREIALPLTEGFSAYWRGDYPTAVEKLHAARFIANGFGGSHAQRDVIDWTLTESAARSGSSALARALAHERLALKPHSAVNRRWLARALQGSAAEFDR